MVLGILIIIFHGHRASADQNLNDDSKLVFIVVQLQHRRDQKLTIQRGWIKLIALLVHFFSLNVFSLYLSSFFVILLLFEKFLV